jgi:hypothetical protein
MAVVWAGVVWAGVGVVEKSANSKFRQINDLGVFIRTR